MPDDEEGLFEKIRDFVDDFETYVEVSRVGEIARRYFVMNAFDGALTMLGFVVGSFLSGLTKPHVVVSGGLGASLAMGISGFVGALLSEKAEREREIRELEKTLFTRLKGTGNIVERANMLAVALTAIVDATAPALAAIISAAPFIYAMYFGLEFYTAVISSIIITLLIVFLLGVYLGKISGENPVKYGLIMVLAGLLISLITLFSPIT